MIPYEIAVVAHSDRAPRGNKLANRVHANCLSIDDGTMLPGHNHLRAWQWLSEGPQQWSVVLEDDAIPSSWFLSGDLKDVLDAAPGPVVSLYLGRGAPRHWQPSISSVIAEDVSWLMCSELLHHVGVAVKTSVLPVLLDGIPKLLNACPIDEAIGKRCRTMGVKIAYCRPSIVDHDHTLPTVVMHRYSQHETDPEKRSLDETQRRAWLMAHSSPTWDDSSAVIPEPSF